MQIITLDWISVQKNYKTYVGRKVGKSEYGLDIRSYQRSIIKFTDLLMILSFIGEYSYF